MDASMPQAALRSTQSFGEELRELARLGAPIALVQVGLSALGFVDGAFLGHYQDAALPAMSLGNQLVWLVMVFGLGLVMATDPLLSQAVGAKDSPAVTRALLRGGILVVLLSIPAALLLLPAPLWLEAMQQKTELIPGATTYARINTLGILPFLGFSLLRGFLSAHSRTTAQLAVILAGNLLNALLDWAWIYGKLGFPELGIAGSAWATVVSRWFMFALLCAFAWPDLAPHLRHLRDAAVRKALREWRPLWHLLKLGAPIGGQFALEFGVFALTLLLIGQFDQTAATAENGGPRLGGHQVALTLASMSYMVPLGLSMAASVRVGWAVGRGDPAAVRRTTVATLCTSIAVMSMFMLLFLLLPSSLAVLMSDVPGITQWAVVLIPIAGVFQIFDGLQVSAIGCLRGMGDVRMPLLANVVGYWGLALPLGCWLALPWGLGMGPEGLWWGLTAGLGLVGIALVVVLRWRLQEVRARLSID
jgi:MATE family multidrug resistance protein